MFHTLMGVEGKYCLYKVVYVGRDKKKFFCVSSCVRGSGFIGLDII